MFFSNKMIPKFAGSITVGPLFPGRFYCGAVSQNVNEFKNEQYHKIKYYFMIMFKMSIIPLEFLFLRTHHHFKIK